MNLNFRVGYENIPKKYENKKNEDDVIPDEISIESIDEEQSSEKKKENPENLEEDKNVLNINKKNNENSNDIINEEIKPKEPELKLKKKKKSKIYAFEEQQKEEEKKEEEEEKEIANEKNIMFEEKNIGVFQLYCTLSNGLEVFLMIIAVIGSMGSGLSGPLMSWLFGDTVNDASGSINIDQMPQEVKDAFQDAMDDMVYKFLYIGAGMFVANFLANFGWSYSSLRQIHNLKEKYFTTILKQEQGWFDEINSFEFATKVQAQITSVESGLGEKLGQIIQNVCQLIGGLIISFLDSWKLTLVMLAVSPGILLGVLYLLNALKTSIVLSRKTYEHAGGIAEEMLYNIKTVTSFGNFDFEKERYSFYVDKVLELDKDKAFKLGASIGVIIFFMTFEFFIAIYYTSRLIYNDLKDGKEDPFTGGDAMTVIMASMMAIMGIGMVAPNLKLIQEGCVASSDFFTLLERKPKMDLSGTEKPPRDQIKGRIEFKNISFIYPSDIKRRKILNGLNLVMEPGQKVALVGESGCGKSTTINLIERLYEPAEGEVTIDGINVKDYDIKYLRNLIGYVQQEPVLFNKSIKYNLIFGREEYCKTLGDPDELMKNAASDASAKGFIEMKQEGYDYVVGIKGGKLSGGQKQRLAIARAILCKPKILILDEATSALDNKSEKEVQAALDEINNNNSITTIIIAHRLSTIKNADVIYALKNGKVEEFGTHEELLQKGGYYANLVKSQISNEELTSKEENITPLQRKATSIMSEGRKKELKKMIRQSSIYSNNLNFEVKLKKAQEKPKTKVRQGELYNLLGDSKCRLVVGAIASFIGGSIAPIQGFILSKSINTLTDTSDIEKIKDDGLFWSLMFLVVAVGNGLAIFIKLWCLESIGSIITCKMRKLVISKYLTLHIGFFDEDDNAPGALLTRLSIDTTSLSSIVTSVIGDFVGAAGTAIVGFTLSFIFSWRLTLIAICFLPFIIYSFIIINRTRRGGRDEDKLIDIEAGSVLSECVINTKTIYSFNFQEKAIQMYLDILEDAKSRYLIDSLAKGFFLGLGVFAMFASNATVFHYSAVFIIDGKLSYNKMNQALNVVSMTTSGISQGLSGITQYSNGKKAFQSVFNTMDTETLIDPTEEANKGKTEPNDLKGKIEFKNVVFAYPTRPEQKILKGISFVINPGQSSALVGFSGCGKSTAIQLIERFYDPDEGEVLIDDVNIKEYNLYQLRKKIGLVLFIISVYENILYWKIR